jgi:hypothetical protein
MGEEEPSLERAEALLREAVEDIEAAGLRVSAVVKDAEDAVRRLREGLRERDAHVVEKAVEDIELLAKYAGSYIHHYILNAEVKLSKAGLIVAALREKLEKRAEERK